MRKNVYVCSDCGLPTVTVDVEDGVTSFMIICGACKGLSYSCCYKPEMFPANLPEASFEWYRPIGSDYWKLSREMRLHVDMGGLDIRPITAKTLTALREEGER